jgi:hypothetical protein
VAINATLQQKLVEFEVVDQDDSSKDKQLLSLLAPLSKLMHLLESNKQQLCLVELIEEAKESKEQQRKCALSF